MKHIFSTIVISLMAWTTTFAQNTPRLDQMLIESSKAPVTTYDECMDSLITFVLHRYGGASHWSGLTIHELSSPVRGDDNKLRMISSHIAERLSVLNSLQAYSERIDDGQDLRGRFVMKLKPEGNDTSAYVFAKYDRRTIILKLLKNKSITLPATTGNASKVANTSGDILGSAVSRELTAWKDLRREFYHESMGRNVQVKWTHCSYDEQDEYKFFVTTPAPDDYALSKQELIQLNDSDKRAYERVCFAIEIAGQEEGSSQGVLSNPSPDMKDSCEYHYAVHTMPNGLTEFIGVTHEAGVTYLVRATSEEPGLCVWPWGKPAWVQEEETNKDEVAVGVYVIDDEANKTIKDARLTFYEPDKKTVIKTNKSRVWTVDGKGKIHRHVSWLPIRKHYMVKVEADGYETAWGEITLNEEKMQGRTEVLLHKASRKK